MRRGEGRVRGPRGLTAAGLPAGVRRYGLQPLSERDQLLAGERAGDEDRPARSAREQRRPTLLIPGEGRRALERSVLQRRLLAARASRRRTWPASPRAPGRRSASPGARPVRRVNQLRPRVYSCRGPALAAANGSTPCRMPGPGRRLRPSATVATALSA